MSVLFSPAELHNGVTKPKFNARKQPARKKEDDLLVFGYACTIREDSSKALHFEQEKHLIPWMGDDSLLIDRFDARLHFTDKSQFALKPSDLSQTLSPQEEEIERQCDEERYCDLDKDVNEYEIQQEEEMKRFQQAVAYDGAYNMAAFSYEDSTPNAQQPQKQYNPDSFGQQDSRVMPGLETFCRIAQPLGAASVSSSIQTENLETVQVEHEPFVAPEELEVPQDVEIPETTKMNAIVEKTALFVSKQGQQMEILVKAKQSGNPQFEFLNFDNWLNPYYKHMLKCVKEGKYTPQMAKEPSPSPSPEETKEPEKEEDSEDESDGEYELHPLLQASLYRKVGISSATSGPEDPLVTNFVRTFQPTNKSSLSSVPVTSGVEQSCPVSTGPEYVDGQGHMWYTAAQMYHAQGIPVSVGAFGSAAYDSYVSSAAHHYPPGVRATSMADMIPPPPPPPGEGPLEEEWNDVPPTSLAPVLPPPPPPPLPPFLLPEVMSGTFAATPIPPGVSVVPRGTDIVPPPPDIQPIIDKLANYVARNGADFETIVKAKNDDRFAFLNPWDVHHPYYLYKKQLCREEKEKEELDCSKDCVDNATIVKGPISFSIKAKDGKKPKIEYRTSVIYKQSYEPGESDEEESEGKKEEEQEVSENGNTKAEKRKIQETSVSDEPNTIEQSKETDMGDLKEQMKSIEAAEREVLRLEAESRDKQIQLERRRRASLFISMLKKTSGGTSEVGTPPQSRSESPAPEDIDVLSGDEPSVKRPRFKEKPLTSGVGAPSNDSIRVTQDLMAKVKAASKR